MKYLKKVKLHAIHYIRLILLICLLSCLLNLSKQPRQSTMHHHSNKTLNHKQSLSLCESACEFTVKGVLDRFENNIAVILIEEVNQELMVPKKNLPNKSYEGTWFLISITTDGFHILHIDKETTQTEKEKSLKLLKKLKNKSHFQDN